MSSTTTSDINNNIIKPSTFKYFSTLLFLGSLCISQTYGFSTGIGRGSRESRKLFGGYRITPHFCKATRSVPNVLPGPNICMFNHECLQRNGHVVGACMDGFLFGACCQLPADQAPTTTSHHLEDNMAATESHNNNIELSTTKVDFTTPTLFASSISKITESLLPKPSPVLDTVSEDAVVQVSSVGPDLFKSNSSITYTDSAETVLLHSNGTQVNDFITPEDFKSGSQVGEETDRTSTLRIESSTKPFYYHSSSFLTEKPIVQISVANSEYHRPNDADKYVLVPTISKPDSSVQDSPPEIDSIVDIIQMLNVSASRPTIIDNKYSETTSIENKQSTPSYYYSSKKPISSSKKPPSTSYIYSSSSSKRPTTSKPSTTYIYGQKRPSTGKPSYISSTSVPLRPTILVQTSSTKKPPSTSYIYGSTKRPSLSTIVPSSIATTTTKKPPSTSYVFSTKPIKPRPTTNSYPSSTSTYVYTPVSSTTYAPPPGFNVESNEIHYSPYPTQQRPGQSPPPTVIVLGPIAANQNGDQTKRPQVTINHVVQSSSSLQYGQSTERPTAPTVLITPKPTTNLSPWTQRPVLVTRPVTQFTRPAYASLETTDYESAQIIDYTPSPNDFVNFPPVRNPNLNMSNPTFDMSDDTTPPFIEDHILDDKVEGFVNKIIESLQGPFDELKDIVLTNKTITTTKKPSTVVKRPTSTKKPATTTKKPLRVTTTTTRRPPTRRPTSTRRPATSGVTTRRPTTSGVTTRRPTTNSVTTKKPKPTRKPTTTTVSYIETDQATEVFEPPDYKKQCGVRPHMKYGRIVGGKGSTFGEWPWQVLVKESTWLGLFTKNKCGGVLISHKHVITAAHCQPGFLASLVAVFGEFDISGDLESKRPVTRNVKRVIVHRQYDAATFENDLALLELESAIQYDTHIVPICLPPDDADFTGRMATVTGWGRLKYGGGVPSVLQEVQVPIMENHVCQEMFRTAGHSKVILNSFLCAGYANGQKDSCEGDSGGPLVLQRPDGRWELAGTVSHGIKCAAPYLPGVYMRTTYYKPWLSTITGVK